MGCRPRAWQRRIRHHHFGRFNPDPAPVTLSWPHKYVVARRSSVRFGELRLVAAVPPRRSARKPVLQDGQPTEVSYRASRPLVMRRVTITPSALQSQEIEPPSWTVMARLRSLLPYPPSPAGEATVGPPRSVQTTTTSVSWTGQAISNVCLLY